MREHESIFTDIRCPPRVPATKRQPPRASNSNPLIDPNKNREKPTSDSTTQIEKRVRELQRTAKRRYLQRKNSTFALFPRLGSRFWRNSCVFFQKKFSFLSLSRWFSSFFLEKQPRITPPAFQMALSDSSDNLFNA